MTATLTATPTPLQTILCPIRYPFATARVDNGKITCTLSYQSNLEDCYTQTHAWRQSLSNYNLDSSYIMAVQQEINGKSYWVAV